MKTAHLFLSIFALSLLFTACSSDDDNSQQQEDTTQLDPVITAAKITYLECPPIKMHLSSKKFLQLQLIITKSN